MSLNIKILIFKKLLICKPSYTQQGCIILNAATAYTNLYVLCGRKKVLRFCFCVMSFLQFILFGTMGILSEKCPSPCLVSRFVL